MVLTSLTTTDVIVIVITSVLSLITILLVIWQAEEQMFVFGLRPSESTSTDIAGLITLTRGLAGDVNISYSDVTDEIIYNVTIENKLVCVTGTSHYTSTDCSSTTDGIPGQTAGGKDFTLFIEKTADDFNVVLKGLEN